MSSPIHRYLFSPPNSPPLHSTTITTTTTTATNTNTNTNTSSTVSPTLQALESVKDFFLPSPRSYDERSRFSSSKYRQVRPQHHRQIIEIEIGPGGFSSTKAYPSRLSHQTTTQPTIIIVRPPQENAFASSSTSTSTSTDLGNKKNDRRLSSIPINICTTTPLTPPSLLIPLIPITKPIIRVLVMATLLITTCLLITSYGSPPPTNVTIGLHDTNTYPHSLPTTTILKELQRFEFNERNYPIINRRRRIPPQTPRWKAADTLDYTPSKRTDTPNPRTQRHNHIHKLPPQYELLALQSFLLESPTHNLPDSVEVDDENVQLDIGVLLGHHIEDLDKVVEELKRDVEPVVVWAGVDSYTEPIERILRLYQLDPVPQFIRMETRGNVDRIQNVLSRLVPTRIGTFQFPMIVIGGKVIGNHEQLFELHRDDKLADILNDAGALVDGAKGRIDAEALEIKRMKELKQVVVARGSE